MDATEALQKMPNMPSYNDVSVFDAMEMIVFIVDSTTHEVLFANRTARETFGATEHDPTGKKCYAWTRDREKPCAECPMFHNDEASYQWDYYNEKCDRYYRIQANQMLYRGKHAYVKVYTDITTFIRQRNELQIALEAESSLNETLHVLHAKANLDRALDRVLEHVATAFMACRCFILDTQQGFIRVAREYYAPNETPLQELTQRIPLATFYKWTRVVPMHKHIVVENVEDLKETRPEAYTLLKKCDIQSFVAAPIMHQSSLLGILVVTDLLPVRQKGAALMLPTLARFIATATAADQRHKLLERASYTDAMTGVANHNAFLRDIEASQQLINEQAMATGVIYFDLNGLKHMNDVYGHQAGDAMIITLANSIARFFRRNEIYRTGGDEFVALCVNMTEMQFESRLSRVMNYIDSQDGLSVSIGYAWRYGKCISLQQIIAEADAKMYAEKQAYYEKQKEKQDPE